MKILFVYPDFPDTFWGFRHALKFVSKKASFPPLGLLTVAAMLFFWTLFKHPRCFPMAITYAIYGYHFRKILKT